MDEQVTHGETEEVYSKKREQQVQRPRGRKEPGMLEEQRGAQCNWAERMVWEEVGEAGRGQVTQGLKALAGFDFSPTALGSH